MSFPDREDPEIEPTSFTESESANSVVLEVWMNCITNLNKVEIHPFFMFPLSFARSFKHRQLRCTSR